MDDQLIDALRRAVDAAPEDIALRVHLGQMLLAAGRAPEATAEAAVVLAIAPDNIEARAVMMASLTPPGIEHRSQAQPISSQPQPISGGEAGLASSEAPIIPITPQSQEFDWHAAEQQVDHIAEPSFIDGAPDGATPAEAYSAENPGVTFADVGGMEHVKHRLTAAFLAPLANPELRALYGKSLRGGLLLYGPPGCGKTYIARAVAGELGARFISVGITDILDPYIGASEQNLRNLFEAARRAAPCVLFFDEVDGAKRGARTSAAW